MRTLIVHNPASGPRSDDIFAFQRALLSPGDEVVVRTTSAQGNVAELLGDAPSFDRVVASGGDGTIADVAYALASTDIPMLVFPSGTANLLANNIGNASEPSALAETLKNGKSVYLDMCELVFADASGNEHRRGSMCMAGAGYDASLMLGSTALKDVFGQFSYYLAALGNLDPQIAHLHLDIDSKQIDEEGIGVLVSNWACVGDALTIIPNTDPQDGLLDIAVITAKNGFELLPAFMNGIVGHRQGAEIPNIALYQGYSVTVTSEPAFRLQYDGNVIEECMTPFSARVLPKALRTMVDDFSPLA